MRESGPHRHPWYDVGWPVSAGVVAAIGVVAASRTLGPVPVVVTYLALDLILVSAAWPVAAELGRPAQGALLEGASGCTLAVVAALGLVAVVGAWALPVLIAAAATSPWLQPARVARRVRAESEVVRTRRAFDEIVTGMFDATPGDDQEHGR